MKVVEFVSLEAVHTSSLKNNKNIINKKIVLEIMQNKHDF